jgi:hypothetical protein
MRNIEEVHCGVAIQAVLNAYLQLMFATVEEALKGVVYGKSDTLGLDGIPESAIANSLRTFDTGALLITEEIGTTALSDRRRHSSTNPVTFYLSDPTDRSSQLRQFLSDKDPSARVGDLMERSATIAEWEASSGDPASITGATSAITCIRYSVPIATVIVNFVTHELFVASRAGVFRFKLPHYSKLNPETITPEHVRAKGKPIFFRAFQQQGQSMESMRYFVTFLGKSGYKENFEASDLIACGDTSKYLRYDQPGGPSRPLYLSTVEPVERPVGFILANGEKIGEWIHWIAFVRFGVVDGESTRPALSIYEIHQERPWTKEGILMSTPPPYSIFSEAKGAERTFVIDVEKMRFFPNPSRIRSTLLVAPATNTWAITVMERHLYREIVFSDQR